MIYPFKFDEFKEVTLDEGKHSVSLILQLL